MIQLIVALLKWFQRDQNSTSEIPPHIPPASIKGPPVGKRDSVDIADAHIYLQERWPKLLAKFEEQYPGYTLKIAFVWRSVAFQQELYTQGRRGVPGEAVVTNCDGVKNPSKHNAYLARAIDVDIYINGKITWNEEEYAKITPIAQEVGLVHGLTWKSLKDPQHLELPKNIA